MTAEPTSTPNDVRERLGAVISLLRRAEQEPLGTFASDDSAPEWLGAYCDDDEKTDTFNLACELGFLRTLHDVDTSSSTTNLTKAGRLYLSLLSSAWREDIARGYGNVQPNGRIVELKTWPGPFAAIRLGLKPWELRRNDRDYQVGDTLRLREWHPGSEKYTGEVEERLVAWVLTGGSFGLPADHCIMTLAALSTPTQGNGSSGERAEALPSVGLTGGSPLEGLCKTCGSSRRIRIAAGTTHDAYDADCPTCVGWLVPGSNIRLKSEIRE